MIVEWEPEAVRVVVPSAAALGAAGAWVVEIPGLHRALLTSRAAGTAAAAFVGAAFASAADAAGTDPSFLRVDLDNDFRAFDVGKGMTTGGKWRDFALIFRGRPLKTFAFSL